MRRKDKKETVVLRAQSFFLNLSDEWISIIT